MDNMKSEKLLSTPALSETQRADKADGTFKFTLASQIEEADLQQKVDGLLKDITTQGNLLAKQEVPQVMVDAFHAASGSLAERLMTALKAGLAAGGEAGPVHSAGLLVVDKVEWPVINLRVDWSETPIEDLYQLWKVYEPQVEDYVVRAINPASSPSYGVPGDE